MDTNASENKPLPRLLLCFRIAAGFYALGCLIGPAVIQSITLAPQRQALLTTALRWQPDSSAMFDIVDVFVGPLSGVIAAWLCFRTYEPADKPSPPPTQKSPELPDFLKQK